MFWSKILTRALWENQLLEVFLEDVENELTYAKQDHSTK